MTPFAVSQRTRLYIKQTDGTSQFRAVVEGMPNAVTNVKCAHYCALDGDCDSFRFTDNCVLYKGKIDGGNGVYWEFKARLQEV